MVAKSQFHGIKMGHQSAIDWFEQHLRQNYGQASQQLYQVVSDLRSRAYTLARASESEIIAQLQRRPIHAVVNSQILHQIRHKDSVVGGNIAHRINLYVDKLRRKITTYAQTYALSAKDPEEFARDISIAFPRARKVTIPRRILKPQLMEARVTPDWGGQTLDDTGADIAIDNIDQATWDDMLDAYKDEYVPKTRGPEFEIGDPEVTGQDTWYAWEFERDMTNEFVQSVRDGTMDAATSNGITDFVWIAIVDNVTDDCCLWRDGLLVSEIEAQLDDHEDEDEGCDDGGSGLTPPIHFNCRCTLSPATDEIPDKPDDGAQDFEDWLDT